MENEEGEQEAETAPKRPDYARGEVLLESSDEESDEVADREDGDESDTGGVVTLGRDIRKPISLLDEDDPELEIDLDESNFADLDAQAAAYANEHEDHEEEVPEADRTRRLAVVNLDWDHVRAIHLYKIFSSYVSPTGILAGYSSDAIGSIPRQGRRKGPASQLIRGKVFSVRVYPSEFGKERMAREDKEGPPTELFQGDSGEAAKADSHEVGGAEDYNEEALRKYQLARLRYISFCNVESTASQALQTDIITPSLNATVWRLRRICTTNWKARN